MITEDPKRLPVERSVLRKQQGRIRQVPVHLRGGGVRVRIQASIRAMVRPKCLAF